MSREKNINLFDDYLSDRMSEGERIAFEDRLQAEADFHQEFDEYRSLWKVVDDGAEYDAIKADLQSIHENINGRKKKALFLRPTFFIPLAAAAAVTILILAVNPFGTGGGENDAIASANEYNELTSVEDSADEGASSENDDNYEAPTDSTVANNFSDPDSLINPVRTLPIGTCFMISNNGYFITAKHLLRKKRKVRLQQKDLGFTFYAEKVYVDSLLDFAILKCDEKVVQLFKSVPYKFQRDDSKLGQEVFTLGYPKKDIVFTEGTVASETGFRSDSDYFEISMPANPGNSGAPLFTNKGELLGIIAGNNTKKQSVTYVVKHTYIKDKIDELVENDSLDIDIHSNKLQRYSNRTTLINAFRPFIYEIHAYQ